MTNTNLPELPEPYLLGGLGEHNFYTADQMHAYALAALAQSGQGEAVAGEWDGAEEWMPLAWELCADECGEEACTELVWEGGPIPEPWGDRWLQYEDEAKRLIALVRKHTRPQPAQPSSEDVRELTKWLNEGLTAPINKQALARVLAAQPARVVGTVTGYQTASGAQQWQFNPSNVAGLENQRFDVALSTPTAAPTPSQAAVTELETQLADALEKAISGMRLLLKVQSDTAAEYAVSDSLIQALAAYAKKAGQS